MTREPPGSIAGALGGLVLLLALFGPPLAGAEEPVWSEIEKEFGNAARSEDVTALLRLVSRLGDQDGRRAAELLIKYTLFGLDHELELKAGQTLAGMKSPSARKAIYEAARRNKNFKTRIVLLGVAYYQREDPAAFQVLVNALRDPRKEVILSTLRWLRKAGDRRAVTALIGELERWERRPKGRIYYDIRKALMALTAQDLDVAADWKNYWEARKRGAPPPPRREGRTRVESRKFFSVALDSDRVVFIIDVSGSMEKKDPPVEKKRKDDTPKGRTRVVKPREKPKKIDPEDLPLTRQRLYRVKKELMRTIESLPESVFFTVQAFSHQIHFLDDQPVLVQANGANKKRAVAWVSRMKPEGETWTDDAFQRVFDGVKGMDTVIFLSDGAPRRNNEPIPQDIVLDKIRVANRFAKCRVHTIGFQQAGSNLRSFLSKLATEHDGTYTELE